MALLVQGTPFHYPSQSPQRSNLDTFIVLRPHLNTILQTAKNLSKHRLTPAFFGLRWEAGGATPLSEGGASRKRGALTSNTLPQFQPPDSFIADHSPSGTFTLCHSADHFPLFPSLSLFSPQIFHSVLHSTLFRVLLHASSPLRAFLGQFKQTTALASLKTPPTNTYSSCFPLVSGQNQIRIIPSRYTLESIAPACAKSLSNAALIVPVCNPPMAAIIRPIL